jgi:hypothetical protein
MSVALSLFVSIGLAWLILGTLYWRIVYPTLRKSVRYRLFGYRDALRGLAVEGKVSADSCEYQFAEKSICLLARDLELLTPYSFFKYVSKSHDEDSLSKLKEFCQKAPPEVQEIWKKAAAAALNMLFVNSPMTVLFILSMTPVMALCKGGARLLIRMNDEMQAFAVARGAAPA